MKLTPILAFCFVLFAHNLCGQCWQQVDVGHVHCAAIKSDSTLWTWGWNQFGQLGNGTIYDAYKIKPLQVGISHDWLQVEAGNGHTIALKTDGTLWTWGWDQYGQLGNGDDLGYDNNIVKQVGIESNWRQVAAGGGHTAALNSNGSIWAWGANSNGELGNGTTIKSNIPIQLGSDTNWAFVATGNAFTAGIKKDSSLWMWGWNYNGQIGNGTHGDSSDQLIPNQVQFGSKWIYVSTGYSHTMAIKDDGSLWGWGENNTGKLGIGNMVSQDLPVQISSNTNWKCISAGSDHSLAIKQDGTLWAWGGNSDGQLGDSTQINKKVPIQIGSDTNWTNIKAGVRFSAAIQSDGSLHTWGMNDRGQIGDGTDSTRIIPIAINCPSTVYLDSLYYGLCYSPYRDNEGPGYGVHPTVDEIREDLSLNKKLTSILRLYSSTNGLEKIPELCEEIGINYLACAYITPNLCENDSQVYNLIKIANSNLSHLNGLIVGNEVLLRNDISIEELIQYIETVKASTHQPLMYAETWGIWLDTIKYPKILDLVDKIDTILVHIYPYWDGKHINIAADYVLQRYNEMKAMYPDKEIIIGETGWPSGGSVQGQAVPSPENQLHYIKDFKLMAQTNQIPYLYFTIFDEQWKGGTESHWGFYNSNGSLKSNLSEVVPVSAQNGIVRPRREVDSVDAKFPLYVYYDGCDSLNRFDPTGWMNELAEVTAQQAKEIFDESYPNSPYSGESCIRISYQPTFNNWGGIYWQYPLNNWGYYPGYDFSDALALISDKAEIRLRFYARGENGTERIEFKTGGIINDTLPYHDSYGPVNNGLTLLTTNWNEYTISLSGRDLSSVLGGFVWVTNYGQNPQGATFYLDEIVFEVDNDGDGFYSQDDCDDDEATIYPGANEIPNNGIDEDCDGYDLMTNTYDLSSEIITIYPNPNNGHFLLFGDIFSQGLLHVKVFNPIGQLIYTSMPEWVFGKINKSIDLKAPTSGIYFAIIELDGKRYMAKVMVSTN